MPNSAYSRLLTALRQVVEHFCRVFGESILV
jgi:hypothetical protein